MKVNITEKRCQKVRAKMPAVKTAAAIGNQQVGVRKSTIVINLTAYLAGNGEKSWSQTWTHRRMPRAAMNGGNGTGAYE